MPRERIFLKCRLHHSAQARKSATKIGYPCGDPDACSCRQPDHPARHSTTARSVTTSTAPAMRSVPLESFISIVPPDDGAEVLPTCLHLLSAMSETVTGRSLLFFS